MFQQVSKGNCSGFPSVDKPWLKYYDEEQISVSLPNKSIYEYLFDNNKRNLNDYALNYFGKKITYGDFFAMIDETAKAFVALGVQENEIVPIISVSTVTSIVCFYALNRIGAVSDFLNVLSEECNFYSYFSEAKAKVVVTLNLFSAKVIPAAKNSGVQTVISFGVNQEMPKMMSLGYKMRTRKTNDNIPVFEGLLCWSDFIQLGKVIKEFQRYKNPNELCFLAHTGGTTGESKAVMLSDNAMNAVAKQHAMNCCRLPEWKKNSVFLQVMVPFVVYGILTCTHMPLSMGWCLAVIPKFEGKDWRKYITKYKFEHVMAVPAYVTCMLDDSLLNGMDLSQIKTISVGGDGITDSLEENMNTFLSSHGSNSELFKGYGMTEICAAGVLSFPRCNKIGSVGIPLPQNNMMVFDNDKETELSYKEVGEVCLQAPSCMIGYLNNEEATNQLIRVHKDGQKWLHTGDLGYIDEDGFLFLVGRMKRMILTTKHGVAYKVFPSVIEKILDSHHAVNQSCVVGANEGDNQVLRAFVMICDADKSKSKHIEMELRKLCDEHLPLYSRPVFYTFTDKLPLTAAGKVDYKVLEEESLKVR